VQPDSRLRQLADRSVNFGFLLDDEPLLLSYGAAAESYVFDDPNASMVKARQFGEALADTLLVRVGVPAKTKATQVEKVGELTKLGVLTPRVRQVFDEVRRSGNEAVHSHSTDQRTALGLVHRCFRLGEWFHRAMTGDRSPIVFVPPTPATALPDVEADLAQYREQLVEMRTSLADALSRSAAEEEARRKAQEDLARAFDARSEADTLVAELTKQVEQLQADLATRVTAPPAVGARQRDAFVDRAREASRPPLTEAETRREIDATLAASGWVVQDMKDLDLVHHQGVAVREMPLGAGRADYALHVDGKLVGVVEAKREGTALSTVSVQSSGYTNLTPEQRLRAWRTPLPLRYESNGAETWFANGLDPAPRRSRAVFSFHRPETVAGWMADADAEPETPSYRARVRSMPALDEAGLRPAQVDAVTSVEKALATDKPRGLVQMATGAGKTFAAVTLSYRLLKHARAGRVLFLVDRNNLGKQAHAEFGNYVTPDDGRKLAELYGVQRMSGATVLGSSDVVISTVQRLYSVLCGDHDPDPDAEPCEAEDVEDELPVEVRYNADLPPESFDLIIVDECHRSIYGKWREVLTYFDAHLIGLTATPIGLTFGFFGELLSEYTYQQAVADGVNVDFDVFRIRTELGEKGGTIPAETVVPKLNRTTRRQRYEALDDDLTYSGKQLGRSVISKTQLRLVLKTFRDHLYTDIFPGRSAVPKTLIFAKDDNHAEEIVRLVREVFAAGDEFCERITYKATDPEGKLARLRNSAELRIAVTVDMIATGTDVRPLECVFFLRDVQSWAYFEQMKGRGARTVPEAEFRAVTTDATRKDRFVIVDAVGVTDSPRVDATPLQREGAQQVSLERLLTKASQLDLTTDEAATLASRLARLDRDVTDDERNELESVGRLPLRAISRGLVDAVDVDAQEQAFAAGGESAQRALVNEALEPLAGNPELRQRILEIRRAHDIVYDEVNHDTVLGIDKRTFDHDNPKHVVDSWRTWLAEHRDEIDALRVAFATGGSPASAYDQLVDLSRQLARPPHRWTPERLWSAYEKLGQAHGTGRHGVTELVSILRYELGDDAELAPYESKVEQRLAAWLTRQEQAGVRFSADQAWWLERIAEVVVSSLGCSTDELDQMPFTDRGGVDGFVEAFGEDRAPALLAELNEELPA
jgi:type I restriction enzyme R subunit